MASDEHVPPVASVGLVLNLNPYIEATAGFGTDDFAAGVSRGFNFWGRWWGFLYDQSTWGIYYNTGMFEEAGISTPPTEGQTQWSLEEFVEAAKVLTKPDGEQWGLTSAAVNICIRPSCIRPVAATLMMMAANV